MEKTFDMNKEMMKLMMEKAMYARPNFSRKEQEHKRDSSMQHIPYAGTVYLAKCHRNNINDTDKVGKCSYLLSCYRYAQEPRKRK